MSIPIYRVLLRSSRNITRNVPTQYLLRPASMAEKPIISTHNAPRICQHCQRRQLSYSSTRRKDDPAKRKGEDGNIVNEKGERQIDKDKIHEKDKTGTDGEDPRVADIGRAIEDDFKLIKEKYASPKNPIVLAHGLMGFDELRLAGSLLPGLQYWRGITEALRANGCEVIIAHVPASASIEDRALKLGECIAERAAGKKVNIIAHSMGGLDSRYMISRLQPDNVKVLSLTTVASPHRGSAFADFVMAQLGPIFSPKFWQSLDSMGISTGAFEQLTRKFMMEEFNPKTPDDPTVRYFSYGAVKAPTIWSPFRQPGRIVRMSEGENDGLVSVGSAKWGTYKGTLVDVSHLDLINWTNRMKWWWGSLTGTERKFNAIAFYLDIADMLAKEGL